MNFKLQMENVCMVSYIVPDPPCLFLVKACRKESVLNRYLVPGHLGCLQTTQICVVPGSLRRAARIGLDWLLLVGA